MKIARLALGLLLLLGLMALGTVLLKPLSTPLADPFEIEITALMLISVTACAANIRYAWLRLHALLASGENGLLLIMRRGAFNDQIKIGSMALGFFLICVGSLFLPPRNISRLMALEIAMRIMLVGIALLLVWLSIDIRLRAQQLRHEAERGARHDPG